MEDAAAATRPSIVLDGVSKTYRMGDAFVHALSDVTLEIPRGQFVAVTGTSGSGKSTVLQLIGLLDVPTEGVIQLEGRRVDRLGDRAQARMRGDKIGFVFQYFHLYPTLSALENVALPLRVAGVSRSRRRERALDLLKTVGLLDRADHMPHELSGGQRQRVAIARALSNHPSILLADEPTGNLDSENGREVLRLLQQQHAAGTTLVIATHDLDLAAGAERHIKLLDGRVVGDA